MAKEEKLKGPVVHAEATLNGKRVTLVRGGKKVNGVIMSNSGQFSNDELVFKWSEGDGPANISPLTPPELEELMGG